MAKDRQRRFMPHTQRYLLTGMITVIPLWITYLVFKFFFSQLSQFGMPWVRALSGAVQEDVPVLSRWLLEPWFQSALAILLTLTALYLLGLAANWVLGKRMLGLLDQVMERIPLVQTVYGATRKLISALQQKPERVQRVVLIEFPSQEMKAVGFVTRVLVDTDTGEELAAVYVPTTPNPTSGYLEIVPVDKLTATDWTMDEAMSFIISGGAVAPERLNYRHSATPPQAEPRP